MAFYDIVKILDGTLRRPGHELDEVYSMSEDSTTRERIGDFLVRIGAMTPEHQSDVLMRQATEPDRLFGEIAIELKYIDDAAVDEYLAWNRSAG